MRAVVITRHGPPEVLAVQQRPDPTPGPGEVLIDVHAAGINFADLMARLGLYPDAPKPPCVVGYEVAGTVAALGPGVDSGLEIGQRVVAPTRFAPRPRRAWRSAWLRFRRRRPPRGSGRAPPMDAIGGASFRRSYNLLRAGGRLVCFGASGLVSGERRDLVTAAKTALRMPRFNLIKQMSQSKTVIGLNLLSVWDEFQSAARWTAPLTEMLSDGTIKPVLAKTFTFDRAPDAHRFITERRNVGKVVLVAQEA
jgi:NADPH:quinone reductase-like Zn-dependent oxidoreductase